jgi:LmbE family N-acetylglucosaminyl deacetylase
MQIVAHEDDDLLFMNPDLQHALQAGDCIRTVYITAGDAGAGKFYWLGREQGSEAAYGVLTQSSNFWLEQTVKFANHEFATVASPNNNDKLSLVFMHLPDGSPGGQGFPVSRYESLAKLEAHTIPAIFTVDRQSFYSHKTLLKALSALIDVYRPDEIRTQLPYSANTIYTDHSDHTAVGRYVTEAYKSYRAAHPSSTIAYYIGYPIHAFDPNVSAEDFALKEQAFMAYSNYDGAACSSPELCAESGVYDAYLARQYRIDNL